MPKKAKVAEPEDDLEVEEEETEEESEDEEEESEDEEETEEEDEEESEEAEEDAEEEGEVEDEAKPAKAAKSNKVIPGIVLLKNGIAKKVDVVKVMGKNVKVRKPGDKTFPAVRVAIEMARVYEKAAFDKMEENNTKINAWRDKNAALFQKLGSLAGRKGAVKRENPLEEL